MSTGTVLPPSARGPLGRLGQIFLLVSGLLFFAVGVGLLVREWHFARSAMPAGGTVVEVRVVDGTDGPNYTPVVEFTTMDRQKVRFEGVSTSPPPIQGEPVPVLYRPDNPRDARVNTFGQRWLFPTVFTPLGLGLILGGIFYRRRYGQSGDWVGDQDIR